MSGRTVLAEDGREIRRRLRELRGVGREHLPCTCAWDVEAGEYLIGDCPRHGALLSRGECGASGR